MFELQDQYMEAYTIVVIKKDLHKVYAYIFIQPSCYSTTRQNKRALFVE